MRLLDLNYAKAGIKLEIERKIDALNRYPLNSKSFKSSSEAILELLYRLESYNEEIQALEKDHLAAYDELIDKL